ncbi:hypothetical protein C8F01DRAFT_1082526 [Mycena amicta]|nr:hypothetical protein C8F01DRAFT_1082526 [Mycena amicta]
MVADFRFNEARTEVQCIACSANISAPLRAWILVKNAPRHLQTAPHKEAVDALKEAREEVKDREHIPETQSVHMRNPTIAPGRPHVDGLLPNSRPRGVASTQEADMWRAYAEDGASFSAGDEAETGGPDLERLKRQADIFGILDPEGAAKRMGFGDDGPEENEFMDGDEDVDFLADVMANGGNHAPSDAEIQADGDELPPPDAEFFPYPNKTESMNKPRYFYLIFLTTFRVCACQTRSCASFSGFWDWANPTIRKHIHVYPEIPEDGAVREIWHAEKWRKNMDLDVLSPMYDAGPSGHYFVNEAARLKDGKFVVPVRWVTFRSAVFADAYSVHVNEEGEAMLDSSKTILVAANDLRDNYLTLEDMGEIPRWSALTCESGHAARMPNPKRAIAGGDPIYSSFVDFFGDDVSGNRTKSWNKHWNAYMTHRNLPRLLLNQEFHVHFISTSQNATISEQFREFNSSIESTHTEPIQVQDEQGNTTRFCIYCNASPSDNPMQSEISSHIGARGNRFCRKCEVGGTQAFKGTDEGYHSLFQPGILRTKEKILVELRKQIDLACGGMTVDKLVPVQRKTGVKDAYTQQWIIGIAARFEEMQTQEPDRSKADIKSELADWAQANEEKLFSAFLNSKGFDPTRHTPVELLHTILIGGVKYSWHISHSAWSAESKQTYTMRLQATETDGLSIHAIRAKYIMQYAGSLIGKQFKTIVQTAVFHVHDLVSDDYMTMWKALGELSALLWFTEIRNPTEYQDDLKTAVANLLDAISVIDPSKIITKIKYHLLVHVHSDAIEFGPLIGMATELFESFNAIFRYCSILSNGLAPSRDIALQLGNQEALKHRLTGGRWASHSSGSWEQAGTGVRSFLEKHPVLQRLLGWTPSKVLRAGDIKLVPLRRGVKLRVLRQLSATSAVQAVNYGDYSNRGMWDRCKSTISASLDECFDGSWVFAKAIQPDGDRICGRITEILTDSDRKTVVILEPFAIQSERDLIYGMPVLARRHGEVTTYIVPAANLEFKFNVQHDCCVVGCDASGIRAIFQERVESDKSEAFIIHKPVDRFIINMHAFHNAHLLRATLPRSLWAPVPLFPDRVSKHKEFAAQLRDNKSSRKAQLAERRAGTTKKASNTTAAAAASKKQHKRRRSASAEDAPPAKRGRPRKEKAASATVTSAVSIALTGGTSLAAGRTKRTIKQTEKAIAGDAAPEESDLEESRANDEAGEDSDSDSDELYSDSD